MSTSLVCLLAACCWPSNDKDVTDAIKQCMDDDDQTAHTAMRTLAAQAEDDEMWVEIVMKVARKFGQKQWRRKDGQRTDAATQLLLLMELMPLCDSRRALNTSEDLLSFARDEANAGQMRNALVAWNAFAGKFDLRVGSRMLTDDVLLFLMDNANHRYTTDSEVCMHALLTLEKFSKTGPDNARRISELGYFERLEELLHYSNDHQLRLVCEWGLAHGSTRSGVVGTDAAAAARKRKRGVHAGSGGGSSSDSDREENTPGREKKPKKILHVAAAAATTATNAMGDGDQAAAAAEERQVSSQHNGARRGSKSSRSRRRREEEAAAAEALSGGGGGAGGDGEEDGDELDFHEMDLESRMPPGKQVTLSFADRTNFIKLSADCYEVRNDSASFGSIRANCYVSAVDRNGRGYREGGRWYYEVTLRTGGIMQVGWATKDSVFKPEEGSGIGDDFFSYAYDGCRRQAWHAATSAPCGRKERRWKAGDVVGCLFDTKHGVMAFTLNGKFSRELGSRTFVGVRHGLAFYPALSLGAFQQCRFNFGSEPFKFQPAGYQSVNEFATRYDIALEESTESAAEGERPGAGMAWSAHAGAQGGVVDDPTDQLDDDELCKICYAQEDDIKLHPCGHQEICFACSIRPIDDREHTKKKEEVAAKLQPVPTTTLPTHQHHHHNQPLLVQL
ncbi:SPRY domain containing protein [Acanthamoeba castellanii str. Neff]|uniref:SPRY domain containing protein n=1 Tax=Acanthamoeba castellanii (strain ATCC 30010 / Neff) TaxID=1257118 RepID=L8H461_ACACF|nr:SPRY domain containing protein [Acanthamoeba castellanii str. Neff]ELR20314.1 SPRY domain containing protein [Acanthamoeba castellanii str. Neff]